MSLVFYSASGPDGFLSNFSQHGFTLDGVYWPTVEHYFQAQKFTDAPTQTQIRRAPTPKDAKRLGRRRDWPLRPDWETIKEDVMHRALVRKFETHADLRVRLLATGDHTLIENAPADAYWGCGADGSGQNRLGHLLMQVRDSLRAREGDHPTLFSLDVARGWAARDAIETWIQAYLTTGHWANVGLAEGLKLQPRWWLGPLELPLPRVTRCCGPEDGMEFPYEPAEWDRVTGALAQGIDDLRALPPLDRRIPRGRTQPARWQYPARRTRPTRRRDVLGDRLVQCGGGSRRLRA